MHKHCLNMFAVALTMAVGCNDAFRAKTDADLVAEKKARADEASPEPAPRILPETYLAAGQMLEGNGDLANAIGQYEKAVAAAPRMPAAYNRLGIAHQKVGRFADAESAFRRGLDVEPSAAFLHNNLGYCYVAQSKWDAAEREFRAALSLRPAFQRARMNLGTVLGRTGRFDESLREFTQILPAETAHFNVGILCLQLQQYEKAEKSFEKALAINPECPGAGEYLMQLRRIAGLKPAAAAPAIIPAPAVQVLANQPILAGPAAVDPAQQP